MCVCVCVSEFARALGMAVFKDWLWTWFDYVCLVLRGYAANSNVFDTIQDLSVQGQLFASKTVEAFTVSVQISHNLGIKF